MSSVLINGADKVQPFEKTISLTSTYQAVFTNDLRAPCKLVDIGLCNYHTSAVVIGLQVYRSGAVPVTFRRLSGYSLAANATLELDWATMLDEDDELRVSASVPDVVDVTGLVVQAFGR